MSIIEWIFSKILSGDIKVMYHFTLSYNTHFWDDILDDNKCNDWGFKTRTKLIFWCVSDHGL